MTELMQEPTSLDLALVALRSGDKLLRTEDGHLFVVQVAQDQPIAIHSGRTRLRIECSTCKCLVHPGTTGAAFMIRGHLRDVADGIDVCAVARKLWPE